MALPSDEKPDNPHLPISSIPLIDLRFLSQDEISSLALLSLPSSNPPLTDIVVPKIDRSIFNESQGSRKQTYSRLRLSHKKQQQHQELLSHGTNSSSPTSLTTRRRAGLLSISRPSPTSPKPPAPFPKDPDNERIVQLLRELFAGQDTTLRASSEPSVANARVTNNVHLGNARVWGESIARVLGQPNAGVSEGANSRALGGVGSGVELGSADSRVSSSGKHGVVEGQSKVCDQPINEGGSHCAAGNAIRPFELGDRVVGEAVIRQKRRVSKKEDARRKGLMSLAVLENGDRGAIDNNGSSDFNQTGIGCHGNVRNGDNKEKMLQNGFVEVHALASRELFVPHLKKRTAALENELELVEFLDGLGGEWVTKRKKRKMVDASDFGDGLPDGWKVILGIRKKEGKLFIDCRKYISPTGQKFATCKEVTAHLLSEPQDGSLAVSARIEENMSGNSMRTRQISGATHSSMKVPAPQTKEPKCNGSISKDSGKQIISHQVDNPIKLTLECRKCNLNFNSKEVYMHHLLAVHQRKSKRCRLGKSLGEGVLIEDGKYVCQICHKVFGEKHRYNGHVGVHVRNYFKSLEASQDQAMIDKPIAASSLDVGKPQISDGKQENSSESIEGDGNSDRMPSEDNLGALLSKSSDEPCDDLKMATTDNLKKISEKSDVDSDENCGVALVTEHNGGSSCETGLLSCNLKGTSTIGENYKSGFERESSTGNGSVIESCIEQTGDLGTCENVMSVLKRIALEERDKACNLEGSVLESCSIEAGKDATLSTVDNLVANGDERGVTRNKVLGDPSSALAQSSGNGEFLSSLNMISDKGEDEFSSVSHKFENISGFDDLKLEDISPSKFSYVPGEQDSSSLAAGPMDLDYAEDFIQEEIEPSVRFEWDPVVPNMGGYSQVRTATVAAITTATTTTICVWCRSEFNHEGLGSEAQSDSVGFMCPTCKAKISGQLNNVIDNGLSCQR
ncbi:uncharacterized protein LOC18442920 isoform X2 [Amborella trichopoda]|uniref:uncharacterized protein LOC18442920 isoform X2 n=1 Tax=Amborella trichopoda TaxID=13333 RepID=UPI0005D2D42A|nr:uncharacterized protein LOC18442920 isoform X2 [Amborella trichopoda]|eukprot:XP_011626564.1 uncharacterized protein LOC18442920 isoform X2 [Amborella trichopoda]